MKRSLGTLTLVVVILASAVSLLAAEKWKGAISDKMCGAKHMMAGASDPDCTTACVKRGTMAPSDGIGPCRERRKLT